jgi:hypothetical protein
VDIDRALYLVEPTYVPANVLVGFKAGPPAAGYASCRVARATGSRPANMLAEGLQQILVTSRADKERKTGNIYNTQHLVP